MRHTDTFPHPVRRLAHLDPAVLYKLEQFANARFLQVRDSAAHLHEASGEADLIDTMREIQDALEWRNEIRSELAHRDMPFNSDGTR